MIARHSSGLKWDKRGFGGFGVVAHRARSIARALEVHRQLGSGYLHSRAALAFEGSADFPVQLCASGSGGWTRTTLGGTARA